MSEVPYAGDKQFMAPDTRKEGLWPDSGSLLLANPRKGLNSILIVPLTNEIVGFSNVVIPNCDL
jgi:hypothetical protein